jgi:L-lactate dehydrogenase complex protein LldF
MRKRFRRRVQRAIADPALQSALERNATRRVEGWRTARQSLPDGETLRERARQVRERTISNLESYLEQFTTQLLNNGWHVHPADSATEACKVAVDIAAAHDAKTIAKSKSMLSEEIRLNRALERSGLHVVETDLGEYIVQLRGETPSHIITPAVHLRREDVAATFVEKLGMRYSTDIEAMTTLARGNLRKVFLDSEIGFSGVNFGVAESGTLCIVTNEGNGRMVTTVPRVHIALMGIERLVPTLGDLTLMLQLLPRAATGQVISTYVSLIQSARRPGDPDGPEERHLILLDNGRTSLSRGDLAEALLCIRCGACLNACPVFREIGGHAYDSVYPGPIGSVISPALFGIRSHGHLAKASTLCGACQEACPVQIDLPRLLLRTRREYVRKATQPLFTRLALKLYAWIALSPASYQFALGLGRLVSRLSPKSDGWLRSLPPPFSVWTRSRHFPPFADRPFRQRFKAAASPAGRAGQRPEATPPVESAARELLKEQVQNALSVLTDREQQVLEMRFGLLDGKDSSQEDKDPVGRFERELRAADGVVVRCSKDNLPGLVVAQLQEAGVKRLLSWGTDDPLLAATLAELREAEIECLQPDLPRGSSTERAQTISSLADAQAGLTGANAGLADTGSVVLTDGPGRPALASLLPPLHVVLLPLKRIHESMQRWLESGGDNQIGESSSVVLVTGPSRTADIEMTLTIGVHGPERVIVFLVE